MGDGEEGGTGEGRGVSESSHYSAGVSLQYVAQAILRGRPSANNSLAPTRHMSGSQQAMDSATKVMEEAATKVMGKAGTKVTEEAAVD